MLPRNLCARNNISMIAPDTETSPMNARFTIAVLQHNPVPGDIDAALERLETTAAQAAADGCNLFVVPECSITGYNQPLDSMQAVAIESDGETARTIADICRQHDIAIAYGFAEKSNGTYYNCVQIIDATGKTVSAYRKSHLWGDLDRTLFTQGDSLSPVIELNGWKIGILICYDVEFPENVRALALAGAELILVPTGLMQPWRDVAERVVPVRAYENQLYIAYCNYCGAEGDITYEGRSCITGPDGADLDRAEKTPVLLTATLNKEAIAECRAALPYHRDRRPELYSSIARNV